MVDATASMQSAIDAVFEAIQQHAEFLLNLRLTVRVVVVLYRDFHLSSVPVDKVVEHFSLLLDCRTRFDDFALELRELFSGLKAFGEGDSEEATRTGLKELTHLLHSQMIVLGLYHVTDAPLRQEIPDTPIVLGAFLQQNRANGLCELLQNYGMTMEKAEYLASHVRPSADVSEAIGAALDLSDQCHILFKTDEYRHEFDFLRKNGFSFDIRSLKEMLPSITTFKITRKRGSTELAGWDQLGKVVNVEPDQYGEFVRPLVSRFVNFFNLDSLEVKIFRETMFGALREIKLDVDRRRQFIDFFIKTVKQRSLSPSDLLSGAYGLIFNNLRSLPETRPLTQLLAELALNDEELRRALETTRTTEMVRYLIRDMCREVLLMKPPGTLLPFLKRREGCVMTSPVVFSDTFLKGDLKALKKIVGVIHDLEIVDLLFTPSKEIDIHVVPLCGEPIVTMKLISTLVFGFTVESKFRLAMFAYMLLDIEFLREYASNYLEQVKGEWFLLEKEESADGENIRFRNPEMFHVPFIHIFLFQPSYLTEEEIVVAMTILLANSLVRRKESIVRFRASLRGNDHVRFATCRKCQHLLDSRRLGYESECLECRRSEIKTLCVTERDGSCFCCRQSRKFSKGQRHHHRTGERVCISCTQKIQSESLQTSGTEFSTDMSILSILDACSMEQLVSRFDPSICYSSMAKLKDLLKMVKPNSKVSDMIHSLTELNDPVSITDWVAILQSLTPLPLSTDYLVIRQNQILVNSAEMFGILESLKDVFLVRPVKECGICGDQQNVHAAVLRPCHVCGFEICFTCSATIEENRTFSPGKNISFNAFRCPGCRTLVPHATATIHSHAMTILVTKEMIDLSRTLQYAMCAQCFKIDTVYPLSCGAANEDVEDFSLYMCKDCSPFLPPEPEYQIDGTCECGIPYEKITDGLPIELQDCNHLECANPQCGRHICAMHGCGKVFDSRTDCYLHMKDVHGNAPVPDGMSEYTFGFGGRYGGNIVCQTCNSQFSQDSPSAYDDHRQFCM